MKEYYIIKPKYGKIYIEDILEFSSEFVEMSQDWSLVRVEKLSDIPHKFKVRKCMDGRECHFCNKGDFILTEWGEAMCSCCGYVLDVWEYARSSWRLI